MLFLMITLFLSSDKFAYVMRGFELEAGIGLCKKGLISISGCAEPLGVGISQIFNSFLQIHLMVGLYMRVAPPLLLF
jgi:hypothetical protein